MVKNEPPHDTSYSKYKLYSHLVYDVLIHVGKYVGHAIQPKVMLTSSRHDTKTARAAKPPRMGEPKRRLQRTRKVWTILVISFYSIIRTRTAQHTTTYTDTRTEPHRSHTDTTHPICMREAILYAIYAK